VVRRYLMSGPSKIMFIRHAEKRDGVDGGVLPDGSKDKESLTTTGWQRAGGLAVLFGYGGAPINPALPKPTLIYATAPGAASASLRPIETITPLSAKLNLSPITTFGEDDFPAMLSEALSQARMPVLICWEHKTLAIGLNAPSPLRSKTTNPGSIPSAWPGGRFDMVWMFDLQANGQYVFSQVPQLLLSGDVATPI
jgi:hypothetical protein